MKAKLCLLFRSAFPLTMASCLTASIVMGQSLCDNKSFRDSLVRKYIDSGAEKSRYYYNDPNWDKCLDSLIAICPNIAEAYQLKAVPAIKNGEYTKAYLLDDKAAELDSSQFLPYLGFLKCIFTKDYVGAIPIFNESVRRWQGGAAMDHSFYFYLGISYLELLRYHEAEQNFQLDIAFQKRGSSLSEIHFNSLLYMGILKMKMQEQDSAIYYFSNCLSIYKELPEANYYLGLMYREKNEKDAAIKYLTIARQSIMDHYTMNEDNLFYVNYPFQITTHEIDEQLSSLQQQ